MPKRHHAMPPAELPEHRSTEDHQQLNLHENCEESAKMRLDISRWRTSGIYDFLDDLPTDGLAWEYLRRNADYQLEFADHLTTKGQTEPMDIEAERRWGLRFPGKTQPLLPRATHLLVT
jgi:hypothetical protein